MFYKWGYMYIDRVLCMVDWDVFIYVVGMWYNVDKVNIYIFDYDYNWVLILRSKWLVLIICWLCFKKVFVLKILVNYNVLSVCFKNFIIFIFVVYELFFDLFFLIF